MVTTCVIHLCYPKNNYLVLKIPKIDIQIRGRAPGLWTLRWVSRSWLVDLYHIKIVGETSPTM